MTDPASPVTVRARVHDGALARVTRMYAATLADIFAELLQNARRAGAARVRVTVRNADDPDAGSGAHDPGARLAVSVTDDGAGIADPAVLLSFGENGWDAETVHREDAAGMGFLSLARRGCTVASRPRTANGAVPGWRIDLAPGHFLGEAGAAAHPDDAAPFPHGTSVTFQAAESLAAVRNAAETAARHYPLPAVFEDRTGDQARGGEILPHRAFLDGACHAERWRGLVFGVFRNRHRGFNEPDLNVHGLTVPVRLPEAAGLHGVHWSVRADIEDCPDLELVLPARKEAVETGFPKEMREAARRAVWRAMAADPDPRPAFEDWKRASDAGIAIAPPPAELRPWRPAVADLDDWREAPKPAAVPEDALVMACDPEPPEAQALWRAAGRAGIARRLFEADRRLDGYPWYDALPRIAGIRTTIVMDGRTRALDACPVPEPAGAPESPLPPRPEAIRMALVVRPPEGPDRTIGLAADLAFAGEAWSPVGDALPLATADSDLQPGELADLLRAAFFSASDDADADARETQCGRFEQEALLIATRLLVSDDEARRTSIAGAVSRELLWLCPRGRTVGITVNRPAIAVTLEG